MASAPESRFVVRGALTAAIGCVLAACGAGYDGGPLIAVRDSAGVRIVEQRIGLSELPVYAQVGPADLSIGVQEGDPLYAFTNVVGVRTLEDGGVVVADGAERTLRVYRADGTHRATMGGEGGGPGEFGALTSIAAVDADDIWAWDALNQRVTHFTTDGRLVDVVTFPVEPPGRVASLSRLGDGSFLATSTWLDPTAPGVEFYSTRLVVDSVVVRHLDATGADIDTVMLLPRSEAFEAVSDAGDGRVRTRRLARPLGRSFHVVPVEGGVVGSWNDTYELVDRDLTGSTRLIVRVVDGVFPLNPAEVERYVSWLVDEDTEPAQLLAIEQMVDDYPPPDTMPAFSALVGDAEGHLWVAEYRALATDVSIWHVFAPTGEILGQVSLEAGVVVHEVGSSHVIAVVRDDLDVPYVRRYPLVRR